MATLSACGGSPSGARPDPERQRAIERTVEALRPMVDRKDPQIRAERLPSGERVKRAYLGESFSNVVLLRQNADGTSSVSCVDSAEQAEVFLSGAGEGR